MNKHVTELARRAVACTAVAKASGLPKWRWLPGMHSDLDNPCTRGGLLQLVRDAWGDQHAYVWRDLAGHWWRTVPSRDTVHLGELASEAEALVAALEAAP